MKEFLSPFQEELTDFLAMRKKTVGGRKPTLVIAESWVPLTGSSPHMAVRKNPFQRM